MIGITLIGGRGGDVGCALTGGDVICISVHICVFGGGEGGEGGVRIRGRKILLGDRELSGGEDGRDFAVASMARKR